MKREGEWIELSQREPERLEVRNEAAQAAAQIRAVPGAMIEGLVENFQECRNLRKGGALFHAGILARIPGIGSDGRGRR